MAALDSRLKEERKRADDQALYYAGTFLLHIDRPDKVTVTTLRGNNNFSLVAGAGVRGPAAEDQPAVPGGAHTAGLAGGRPPQREQQQERAPIL